MSKNDSSKKPWFVPNESGVGYHPASWKGWLVIIIAVAIIATIIILVKRSI